MATVNSALIMNYNKLIRFTGSLIYSIRRFIILCYGPGRRGHGTTAPPKYATGCKYQFLSLLVWLSQRIEPRSTHYKADAQTT